MDQQTRCENCGRKLPCAPCGAREQRALEDALLDRLGEMTADAQPLILWFHMHPSAARQHLNRLCAEWPGALEVIEPIEEGDQLGCRVALSAASIGCNPAAEWEVTETRVSLIDDSAFERALEAVLQR